LEGKEILWGEIQSQAEVWESAVNKLSHLGQSFVRTLFAHRYLYFVGCGSSYHSGLIAKFTYDRLFDKEAICIPASDVFIYPTNHISHDSEKDVFFLISRTGETSETLLANDVIRNHKGCTVALTTLPDSPLSRNCDHSVIIDEGQEKSIPATRSVTAFTTFLLGLCFLLNNQSDVFREAFSANKPSFRQMKEYSSVISSMINQNEWDRFVFLGTGPFLGVAKEAELKVKEMSVTPSESHQTLEYRHGHKSLINRKSLVVLFLSDEGLDYEIKTAIDLKRTGAQILIVGAKERLGSIRGGYDTLLEIDSNMHYFLRPIFYQIFGQLMGYHQAIKRGMDPAKPPDLDFFVTL
jgi:glucosamine--fructose-6-phosphate aminotransferase (isomerizing)